VPKASPRPYSVERRIVTRHEPVRQVGRCLIFAWETIQSKPGLRLPIPGWVGDAVYPW
jgi:hypothetical protein